MDDDFINAAECAEPFSPGERFMGYVIERRIGQGAMGAVYLARHEMLDTLYAIKVLTVSETLMDGDVARRFVREAKIAARIQHPNLVRVHDAGYDETKNAYYLVMDYMAGGTLREKIAFGGTVPAREAVEIVRCVASALSAGAKMGLVHRDLKPENIMFSENGPAKLVDLGIAKAFDDESLHTRTSASFGTPAYVAPEQAVDASKVDSRADVYSLGVILYEMLSGRRPYAGDTPMAIISQVISDEPVPDVKRINPDVPNWASALVMRMCAKDPDKRISSAGELLRVIDVYLHRERESADFSPMPERSPLRTASGREIDEEVEREIADMEQRKAASRRNALLVKIAAAAAVLLTAVVLAVICF